MVTYAEANPQTTHDHVGFNALGSFYLETSRSRRLAVRKRLLEYYRTDGIIEDGLFLTATLEPWLEDPDPPWPRNPFCAPMSELASNAEMQYAIVCLMVRDRLPYHYQTFDFSEQVDPGKERNEQLYKRSRIWEQKGDELKAALQKDNVIGIEGAAADGMKFLVFQTAKISPTRLAAFFDTAKPNVDHEPTPEPFSYLFLKDSKTALDEYKGYTTALAVPKSDFIGRPVNELGTIWENLIHPISECRSMIATHCFIVLDEGTANRAVVKVIVESPNGYLYARSVTFGALKKGILKAFEMLLLDLDALETDEKDLVTEHVYGSNVKTRVRDGFNSTRSDRKVQQFDDEDTSHVNNR